MTSTKHTFNKISGRVLWPLVSKSPTENCIKDPLVSRGQRSRRRGSRVGPKVDLVEQFWAAFSVLFLAVPSSTYWHQLEAEHESSCFSNLYSCIWMFRALEKVTSGKSLRQVRKNILKKCLLTSCLTAILSPLDHVEFYELFFCLGDWKTQVHTQPLLPGLRGRRFIICMGHFPQRKWWVCQP